MAKDKKEINYHQMPVEELSHATERAREDLFKERFRMATAANKNTMRIRVLRREIARLQTFVNQKQSLPAKGPIQTESSTRPAGRKTG